MRRESRGTCCTAMGFCSLLGVIPVLCIHTAYVTLHHYTCAMGPRLHSTTSLREEGRRFALLLQSLAMSIQHQQGCITKGFGNQCANTDVGFQSLGAAGHSNSRSAAQNIIVVSTQSLQCLLCQGEHTSTSPPQEIGEVRPKRNVPLPLPLPFSV